MARMTLDGDTRRLVVEGDNTRYARQASGIKNFFGGWCTIGYRERFVFKYYIDNIKKPGTKANSSASM